jgi:hypothetical protein
MIDDLDDVLRQLLIRELPIKNGEVDIRFDQPKHEWSSRISRPTLDVFLYDVRENQKLRQTQPAWGTERLPDGTGVQRRKPVRMDLHYLITAWASTPEDEHRLLGRTLMALLRFANIPEDLLPASLQVQGKQIPLLIAQYDELPNPTDMWNVLDNEIRPAIVCILTLAFDPYAPALVPLVRMRELVTGESPAPASRQLGEIESAGRFWTIGGHLRSAQPVDFGRVRLTLVEQGLVVPVQHDGGFTIGRLRAGSYTLEIASDGGPLRRFPIIVPSADFELEI